MQLAGGTEESPRFNMKRMNVNKVDKREGGGGWWGGSVAKFSSIYEYKLSGERMHFTEGVSAISVR